MVHVRSTLILSTHNIIIIIIMAKKKRRRIKQRRNHPSSSRSRSSSTDTTSSSNCSCRRSKCSTCGPHVIRLKKIRNQQFADHLIRYHQQYSSSPETMMIDMNPCEKDTILKTLLPQEYLDSSLVDDFIRMIMSRYRGSLNITYINTIQFYTMMMHIRKPKDRCGMGDLDSIMDHLYHHSYNDSDVILVSCFDRYHFCLGIIMMKEKKIILIDSMNLNMDELLSYCMRHKMFLSMALLVLMIKRVDDDNDPLDDWKFIYSRDSIKQQNNYDCGIFVCLNVYSFLTDVRIGRVESSFARKFLYNIMKDRINSIPVLIQESSDHQTSMDRVTEDRKDLIKVEVYETLRSFDPEITVCDTKITLRQMFKL